MTPVYLLGNLHCMGMCGPLTMLLAKHPYRHAYFLGRLSSFSLAGMLAGEIGAGVQLFLHQFHISAITSLLFGSFLLLMSFRYLTSFSLPRSKKLTHLLSHLNQKISLLILKPNFSAVFCFGLATVLLPCGQSLMVFSISALLANPFLGALNGLVFALLTTPSLWITMKASYKLLTLSKRYKWIMGSALLLVAAFALLRGLADLQIIEHLSITPNDALFHISIY